jgi:segregation and condensation protein B
MNGGNGRPNPADLAAEELAQGLSLPLPDETLAVGDWEEALQAGALDSAFEAVAEPEEAASPAAGPEPEGAGPLPEGLDGSEPPPPGRRVAILEALLFASAVPVRTADLQEACGWPLQILNHDLDRLGRELSGRGLELQRVAGAWLLVTAAETGPWVERFLKVQSRKQLSRAQLETLAVVAYRQPVTRAEVDAYRGVRSDRTLHQLEDLRLIREVGRAELPGRPIQFGTTSDFLRYFSLDRLEDLPPVERGSVHLRRLRPAPTPRPQRANPPPPPDPLPEPSPQAESEVSPDPALEEPSAPSQGLRRLLDRIRRRTRRESQESEPSGGQEGRSPS